MKISGHKAFFPVTNPCSASHTLPMLWPRSVNLRQYESEITCREGRAMKCIEEGSREISNRAYTSAEST